MYRLHGFCQSGNTFKVAFLLRALGHVANFGTRSKAMLNKYPNFENPLCKSLIYKGSFLPTGT